MDGQPFPRQQAPTRVPRSLNSRRGEWRNCCAARSWDQYGRRIVPERLHIEEGPSDPLWRAFTLHASTGDAPAPIGTATAWVRPDGRCFVSFTGDAREPLLDAIVKRVGTVTLHATAPASDDEQLARYQRLGFAIERRERVYAIDVARACHVLSRASTPDGVTFVSPEEADLDRLRVLDDTLRGDVPGTDGWKWTAEQFRDETFGSQYDPDLYAVAVDAATGDYVGIARVWNNPSRPRLGMIGVVRSHRRRGLARASMARVLAVLATRGTPEITTEVDVTNEASSSLMLSLGASVTGELMELAHPPGS